MRTPLLMVVTWLTTFNLVRGFAIDSPGHGAAAGGVESVADMEKSIKKLVNSGVKFALPYMMTAVTEIQLSAGCTHGFLKLMRGVMDIRDWAVKMVDALGKPSAGILEGTATALGDYDECLEIVVPKNTRRPSLPPYPPGEEAFRGQYCMVQINIPEGLRQAAIEYQIGNRSHSALANSKTFLRSLVKIGPRADIADLRLGVCIPSTCDKNDLQVIVNQISKMVKVTATALRCELKKDGGVQPEQFIIMAIIAIILFLVIVGTAIEISMRFTSKETDKENKLKPKKSWLHKFILSFSAGENCRKLTSLESDRSELIGCVRGMKFISVCLYVVVSTYATPHDFHFLKYRSAFHFYKFMEEWWFTVFANASAGVDTLFFIAGLQVTYNLWKTTTGNKKNKVSISIPKFIFKWYSRFTFAQLLVIAMYMCLPLIGRGPIWADVVTPGIENCKRRWWLNALSLNNFWPSVDTCLTHTWLMSSLMHILLLASVVLWTLSRWKSIGILLNLILILSSCVAIALVTLVNDMPPAPAFYFLSFLNLRSIWDKLFIQAYDHLAPFCIGVLMGHFLATYKKVELRKTTVAMGWCLAVACNMAVLCGLYGYRHGESMEVTLSAVYASIHRIGWSLGIAWIVFACAYGYGGVINDILSWKMFIPMEKLSNFTYLFHPLILFLHGGQLRERMYMAHLDQAMYATAYIVFTVAFSALCYVSLYVPFTFLEDSVWHFKQRSPRCSKDLQLNKVKKGISTMVDSCKQKDSITCVFSPHLVGTYKKDEAMFKT